MTTSTILYTKLFPRDLVDKEYNTLDITTMPRMANLTDRNELIQNPSLNLQKAKIVEIPNEKIPDWIFSSINRINDLHALPKNWCSPGALPINPQITLSVIKLLAVVSSKDLPEPNIDPMENGSIQISWHSNGIDLEIVFITPENVSIYYEKDGEDEEWETGIHGNLDRLISKINQLS